MEHSPITVVTFRGDQKGDEGGGGKGRAESVSGRVGFEIGFAERRGASSFRGFEKGFSVGVGDSVERDWQREV